MIRYPRRFSFFAALVLVLGVASPCAAESATMKAHLVDVGQGLSIVLEFPCGIAVIDTGAQDAEHVDALVEYLNGIFVERPDLNYTVNLLAITHPHIDHTRGIRGIVEHFRVVNYIDNGQTDSSGGAQVRWVRKVVENSEYTINIRPVDDAEVEAVPQKKGLSDAVIDPFACGTIDPQIRILSAGRKTNPGWKKAEFENANNHSLVIRVDFGKASFLFTGDSEFASIESLLERYKASDLLDVDIYQTSHHGSFNGTTEDLLKRVTPKRALIGVGEWDYGKPDRRFTTYAYGHPRHEVLDILSATIEDTRPTITVKAGNKAKSFSDFQLSKAIYASGWDGDVVVTATSQGAYSVETAKELDGPDAAPLALRPRAAPSPATSLTRDGGTEAAPVAQPSPTLAPAIATPTTLGSLGASGAVSLPRTINVTPPPSLSITTPQPSPPVATNSHVYVTTQTGTTYGVLLPSDSPDWIRVLEPGLKEPTFINPRFVVSMSEGHGERLVAQLEQRNRELEERARQVESLNRYSTAPAYSREAPSSPAATSSPATTSSLSVLRNWTTVEIVLSVLVLLFAAVVLTYVRGLILKAPQIWRPEQVLRAFGLVLVIMGALLLVTAGYDAQQVSAAMGLLGAIAGYLLGTNGVKPQTAKKEIDAAIERELARFMSELSPQRSSSVPTAESERAVDKGTS